MGIFKKIFNKKNKEKGKKPEIKNKELTEEDISNLELKYKSHPYFVAICRYDNCYSAIYKNDKYNTIRDNSGNKLKFHTGCLRKMKKEANKYIKQ